MLKRFALYLIAIFLWLVFLALTRTTFFLVILMFSKSGDWNHLQGIIAFISGILLWFGVYSFSLKWLKSYIFSHEISHLIWALILGSSVKKIKVGATQGKVVVDEINPFIALAPYFFPLYSIILLIVYGSLLLFWNEQWLHLVFALLLGFTLAYHYTFTIKSLYEGQSDIKVYGSFFSYALIFCMNVIVIDIFLIIFTPVSIADFFREMNLAIKWLIVLTNHLINTLWSYFQPI